MQGTLQTDPLHAGVAKEDETWPRSGSDTQAKIEWRWGKKCVYFCDFSLMCFLTVSQSLPEQVRMGHRPRLH